MDEVRLRCLQATKSPFVLDGFHSPVKWWGWCREAFEAARELDKPILVDVGAIWCHWCHVMDETTYSDPEVAEFINRHFIPIKVDRDERPDVDRRLQEAAQLISGQAGWPLTVFMTWEGDVIWAATYLPPRDYGNMPGILRVLRAVLDVYYNKRDEIKTYSRELFGEIERWHQPAQGEPDRSAQLDIIASLAMSFDEEYGGFGGAPKFPPITQLELLLTRYFYDGKSPYKKMAVETLTAMALGGIYDHIGGGFFRYSTDRYWLIPHYEKLLIDNAELLALYAKAYAQFGDRLFLKTAAGIVRWLDRFMRAPGGGYYASQDADVDGEEGAYYRWTLEDLKEAAGDLWDLAQRHFDLSWDWPEGKITLKVRDPHVQGVEELYDRLMAARERRKPPRVDNTIYSGWSCAMAYAEMLASRLAGVGNTRHALATLDLVGSTLWDGSALSRAYRGGEKVGRGTLEDYCHCALTALEAFSHTGNLRYLVWAEELGEAVATRFLDAGGFKDVDVADEVVNTPHYPLVDTPNFSGNSLAVLSLTTLAEVTGRRYFEEAAGRGLRAVFAKLQRLGPAAAGLALAAEVFLTKPPRTVVVGDSQELLNAALSAWRPWHVVVPVLDRWPYGDPAIRSMAQGPRPAAYVCAGMACSMPIKDAEALARTIKEFKTEAYRLE